LAAVETEILERAKMPGGFFCCERCGTMINSRSRGEVDHNVAEALVIDKSKPLTAADGSFLCLACHRQDKTPADLEAIWRAKRRRSRMLGVKVEHKKRRLMRPLAAGQTELNRLYRTEK
jgi:hypothetical protein